jgi:hypothetical protein
MLDTVIKNTILAGLVILIAHFIIKNELVDKSARHNIESFIQSMLTAPSPMPAAAAGPVGIDETSDDVAKFFLEATKARETDAGSPRIKAVDEDKQRSLNSQHQINDLYDYVYNDRERDVASKELGDLYRDSSVQEGGSKKTVKCDLVGNNAGDKRLCKNLIDEHISKNMKPELPLVDRPDVGFKFGTRVKDYDNENVMNGAFIEGTRLTGFDANDTLYGGW